MNKVIKEKQEYKTFSSFTSGMSFEDFCDKLLSKDVKGMSEYVDVVSNDYSDQYDVGDIKDIVFYLQEFIDECFVSNTDFVELLCLGKHSPYILYTKLFDEYGYKDGKTLDCLVKLANMVLVK